MKQKIKAIRKYPISKEEFHIMAIRKEEYLLAARDCANSIWEFMPETKIVLWLDRKNFDIAASSIKLFDRKDRLVFNIVEDERKDWQWTKLKIISLHIKGLSTFLDADLIWNSSLDSLEGPLLFLDEGDMRKQMKYIWLMEKLGLDLNRTWNMLNVSLVSFRNVPSRDSIIERSIELYQKIMSLTETIQYAELDVKSIRRMVEQISLSIAIQESGNYRVVKTSDRILDGGIIESSYLGSSRGWD